MLPNLGYALEVGGELWCLDCDGVVGLFDVAQYCDVRWICLNPEVVFRQFSLPRTCLIDFAELWTFAFPTLAVPRTVQVLAQAIEVTHNPDNSAEAQILLLRQAVAYALGALGRLQQNTTVKSLAAYLYHAHWVFAPAVVASMAMDESDCLALGSDQQALDILSILPKWDDTPVGSGDLGQSITQAEAVSMLTMQLPENPELRPSQIAYTKAVQRIFSKESQTTRKDDQAHIHLLQAGTGIGKTLAYLGSAQLWAERNNEAVWITTYSRHLQDQIAAEVKRVAPTQNVVIRKGRENYLCLLNYDELIRGQVGWDTEQRILLGLIARWMMTTSEGIMIGADFPLWLEERTSPRLFAALRLRNGECIYSACPHYARCFLEGAQRRSRRAKVIIANHALTLRQAIQGRLHYSRIIVDEAHQLFDATDSATRLRLGLSEALELRRWLLGAGRNTRRRARRGLNQRLANFALSEKAIEYLQDVLRGCHIFGDPEGCVERILENAATGILEEFFQAIVQEMPQEEREKNALGFAYEAPLGDAEETPIKQKAEILHQHIERLYTAMIRLTRALNTMLDAAGDGDQAGEYGQIAALLNSLEEYPLQQLHGWLYLLARLLGKDPQAANENRTENASSQHPAVIERIYLQPQTSQRFFEVGLEMVFRDPTEILQNWLYAMPQKAVLLTSASLGVATEAQQLNWRFAHLRTGVHHLIRDSALADAPHQEVFDSPFEYAKQARVLLATDVEINHAASLHAAMLACFLATGGGGLGLFTAIHRAQSCFEAVHQKLNEAGITLYSQHNDSAGNMLLADCMRQQRDSCLLATDAFRDGVDIPGAALRLVVLDRLPWPRPDLIHRHRKQYFGEEYNRAILRQRLMQAFGRLIRNAEDRGSFVLLDRRLPSALENSFPLPVERLPLKALVAELRAQNADCDQ